MNEVATPTPRHKCEISKEEVSEWWYIVSTHRPSAAQRFEFRCNRCCEKVFNYIKQLGELTEWPKKRKIEIQDK